MPMLSEPSVANMSVRVLVNKFEDFGTTCLKSSDADVADGLQDAQRETLTFVGKVTDKKIDTWKLLSDACKRGASGEIGRMSTNMLTPTHPSMTREQIVSKLVSYKGQYDGEDNMTLNAVPNRSEVCKALGVPRETSNFSPTNNRQRS